MDKKVAIVTGGTRGIGKAIAEKLARKGYQIAVNYVSDNTDIDTFVKQLKQEQPIDVLTMKANVTQKDSCDKFVKNVIEQFGRIDVLVNNAGITKDGLIMRMKKEDFEAVIDINLVGTFNVTRNVIPYMIKQKSGRIINVSSVVGVAGNAGQTNYSASKAGIIGFTKSLAKEVASRNILVNAIAPGFIDTDMTKVLSDTVKEGINTQIPLRRMGTPKEVAKVVKFLASEDSSYITGQVINIDGGMVM